MSDHLNDGYRALQQGRHQEAHRAFEAALQEDPKSADAMIGKAKVLEAVGQLGDAEETLMQAVQARPQHIQAWVALISLERKYGADQAAEENLSAALRVLPGQPEILALRPAQSTVERPFDSDRAAIRKALAEDRVDDALAMREKMTLAGADRLSELLADADIAAHTGQSRASVIHELTKVTRQEPHAWEPRVALGRLFLREGPMQNPRMAVAHCEDAFRISAEHPRAGIALVEAWSVAGKTAFALALCKRLAEGDGVEAEQARRILSPGGETESIAPGAGGEDTNTATATFANRPGDATEQ